MGVNVVNKSQQLGKVKKFSCLSNFLKWIKIENIQKDGEDDEIWFHAKSPLKGGDINLIKRQLLPVAKTSEATDG